MANRYIHVGSITNAMRGKKLLEAKGVRSFVHRASNSLDGDGCGYSLLVTTDEQEATKILRAGGVRVVRVSEGL